MLFLVAGNILTAYGSKLTARVKGLGRTLPVSGALWLAGFIAISGSPPFGPFMSEFTILKAGLDRGAIPTVTLYLTLLALIFIGMITVALRMTQGLPDDDNGKPNRPEPKLSVISPLVLFSLVLVLGLYVPQFLNNALHAAAQAIGG